MSRRYANNPIPFTNRGVVQREDKERLADTSGLSCTMGTATSALKIRRSGGASSVLLADTDITNATSLQVTVTYQTP